MLTALIFFESMKQRPKKNKCLKENCIGLYSVESMPVILPEEGDQ